MTKKEIVKNEIDLSTLCQYTGLKDGNGKRIWENDIVLLREEIQNYEWKATVKFGNPNCEYNWGWQLVPIGECDINKDILLWIDMEIANCEVIGNIFDNPELLGQLKNAILDIRLNNTSQLAGFSKFPDIKYFLKELCSIDYISDVKFAPTDQILKDYKAKRI